MLWQLAKYSRPRIANYIETSLNNEKQGKKRVRGRALVKPYTQLQKSKFMYIQSIRRPY